MTTHRQVKLETPYFRNHFGKYSGSTYEVDELMVDILLDVWDLGCRTRYSCQGGGIDSYGWRSQGYLMYHAPYQRQVLEIIDFYSTITERPSDCGNAVWPPGVWEIVRFKPMKYRVPVA